MLYTILSLGKCDCHHPPPTKSVIKCAGYKFLTTLIVLNKGRKICSQVIIQNKLLKFCKK